MLEDRKIDWIQWGRRHFFLGPLGLLEKAKLTLHVAHIMPDLPKNLKINSQIYRNDYLWQRIKSQISNFRESLDYANNTRIELFHKRVFKNINNADIIYNLANGSSSFIEHNANIKIHDQVGCLVTLAEISNKYNKTKIDVLKLYDNEKRLFQSVDLVVCPSQNVRDYVLSIEPKTKTAMVGYPIRSINLTEFKNIFTDKINALYVGRIEKAKGVETIFELARRYPKIKFHCVGQVMMDTSAAPKNVIFYGRLPYKDLAKFYRGSTFLLFPSLSEGSATVTQEAMSYRLPGIVSYQSGSHYVNNKSGMVIDANDLEGFSDAIKVLISNQLILDKCRKAIEIEVMKRTEIYYQKEIYDAICSIQK